MKKQNGSITLAKEYDGNTTVYMTIGYYDTWEEQQRAIKSTIRLLIEGQNLSVDCHTYKRPDGYNATYIRINK